MDCVTSPTLPRSGNSTMQNIHLYDIYIYMHFNESKTLNHDNTELLLPIQIQTRLTVNPHAIEYMITFKHHITCIKYIIKQIFDT